MKRALAMALGAVMVAGSVAPATAASHIDFSGYYKIMYMSETNTSYGREPKSFTDSYFQDRLQLDLTFSPTDEISVYWRLRGPGSYQRWGRYEKNDKSLYTQFIYGEIKQDWGTFLVGRISDDLDAYGLASLGYTGTSIAGFTNAMPFDRADVLDGVRYSYAWDNGFGIMAQYGKLDNNSQNGGRIDYSDPDSVRNGYSDQDSDRFQVEGTYGWDGGGVALNVFFDRDATNGGKDWQSTVGRPTGKKGVWSDYGDLNKRESWGLNPAIMHSWGDFSIHFEGLAQWGKDYYLYNKTDANGVALNRKGEDSRTSTGYGTYLDVDYNYGPGNVNLAAWWVSGSSLSDSKNKSIANLVGGNFYPLLVAYNGVNLNGGGNRYYGNENMGDPLSAISFANNAYENYVREGYDNALTNGFLNEAAFANANYASFTSGAALLSAADGLATRTQTVSFNNDTDANHWAIALTGNHAFTDDISMHYGLAYLALNKPNYRVAKSASISGLNTATPTASNPSYQTQDKDLGFEVDLGFTVQLLDNLSFSTAFGYMFNGDAYKQLKGYRWEETNAVNGDGNIKARWEDADNSYVWFNSLTFAF